MDDFVIIDYSPKAFAVQCDRDVLAAEFTLIGGKYNTRLACGPAWIFSKKKHLHLVNNVMSYFDLPTEHKTLEEITNGNGQNNASNNNTLPDYILTEEERKELFGKDSYDYKHYPIVVKLAEGRLVPIAREGLEKSFCFGYGWNGVDDDDSSEKAHEAAEKARTDGEYFANENLARLRDMIARLNLPYGERLPEDCSTKFCWLENSYANKNHWSVRVLRVAHDSPSCLDWHEERLYKEGKLIPLSDDDRARLLTGYRMALEQREKRVKSYLKKYGTSKLKVWTYLRD